MTLIPGDRVVTCYGPEGWGTVDSEPEPTGTYTFVHVIWDDGLESNSRVDLLERALETRGAAA